MRAHTRLLVVAGALACAATVPMGARQAPAEPQGPVGTFRSSIEAVQISVVVTDADGRPVSGLTGEDFEIREGNDARPITTFTAVDIPLERTERSIADFDVLGNSGPQGRVYLIALDQMPADYALRTRHVLREFLETHFGPNDTAAVVYTTRGLSDSGQEFTSNVQRLLAAIDRFDGGDPISGWEREKNFSSDFRDLLKVLASAGGARKAMILVTQDIPADPYRLMDSRSRWAGGLFSDINPDFHEAISFATRNSIVIYPIDPAGLTTEFGGLDERMNLQGLAELTGGFALTGSNSFQEAFERLVRENSTYYVLGFNSAEERGEGRYVPLQVRVRRPGLQVRAVDGYIAPTRRRDMPRVPGSVLAAVWDAVTSPLTTSGLPMRMYAAPFKGTGRHPTVAITLEIDATRLNLIESAGAHRGELEILFATTDAKRKRHPIYRHRMAMALLPDTYARVSRRSLRVVSELQLPEGRYQIRASAGGALVAGSVVYDLEVPDFRDDFAISGIAVSSLQAQETFTVSPHARIDAALPWAPSTAREFSRDDTVTLFVELYENRKRAHTVTFAMELRDDSGRRVGLYESERSSVDKPRDASQYSVAPNIHLADVPPGRYSIHVDARSSLDKGQALTRVVPIVVR